MHLLIIIHQPQTRQRGRKLKFLQRITHVPIKMAKNALELLELDRGEVSHFSGDHLVLEEAHFRDDRVADEVELVGELVVGVGCEVVFVDVGFVAFFGKGGEGGEVFG